MSQNPDYLEGEDDAERRKLGRQAAIIEAQEDGYLVVYGGPRLLLLDIDSEAALTRAKELLARLRSTIRWTEVEMSRSRSGNYHLFVHLAEKRDLATRQLLAAALGSDPVREVLGWDYALRVAGDEPFFFENPKAKRHKLTMTVERVVRWSVDG